MRSSLGAPSDNPRRRRAGPPRRTTRPSRRCGGRPPAPPPGRRTEAVGDGRAGRGRHREPAQQAQRGVGGGEALLGVGHEESLEQGAQGVGGHLALACRRQPGDELQRDPADGVEVLGRLRRCAARLLGSHVAVGADGTRHRGEPAVRDGGRDAEVAPSRRWGAPSPVASSSRLAGLTSRCTRPAPWTAASPCSSWSRSSAAVPASSGPCSRSRSATEPPATRSIASTTRSSSAAQPCGATTWGWRTRIACSRTKRASSAELCWPRTLTATWRPVLSSRARHTEPMPPLPTWSSST